MKKLIYGSYLIIACLASSCDKDNLALEMLPTPKLNVQDSLAMIDIYKMGNLGKWGYEGEYWDPTNFKTWECIRYKLDSLTNEYRITELHIYASTAQLTDTNCIISPRIADLSELRLLQLVGLGIEGELPQGVSKLKNLIHLEIVRTNLSGSLPDDLFNSSFERVAIADNLSLTGPLPSSIVLLRSIPSQTEFHIGRNAFTGKIPPGIQANIALESNNLTEYPFEYLDIENTSYGGIRKLRHNKISGIIPDYILNDPFLIHRLWERVYPQQEGYGYTNMPPFEKIENDYQIYLKNKMNNNRSDINNSF
ncbi:MAG: hypothetical protein RR212_07070, partial [Bacteroidales bacterium]